MQARLTDTPLKSPGIKSSKSSSSRKISLSIATGGDSFDSVTSPIRKPGHTISLTDIFENDDKISNGSSAERSHGAPKELPARVPRPPRVPPRKPSTNAGPAMSPSRLCAPDESEERAPALPPRPVRAASLPSAYSESSPPPTPTRRSLPQHPASALQHAAPPVPPRPPKTPLFTPLDIFDRFDLPPPGTPPPIIPPKPSKIDR